MFDGNVRIDGKSYNVGLLINAVDRFYLNTLSGTYKADYDFIKGLEDSVASGYKNFTDGKKPVHLRSNYAAFVKVETCANILNGALEDVTRQYITDVEAHFIEKYDVEFKSLLDTPIKLSNFLHSHSEIVANIFKQTGLNLTAAGFKNANAALRAFIEREPTRPTTNNRQIILAKMVSYRKGTRFVLTPDSCGLMRQFLTVIAFHLNSEQGLTGDDITMIDGWTVKPISFETGYHVFNGYRLYFSVGGWVELHCPNPEQARILLSKIKP